MILIVWFCKLIWFWKLLGFWKDVCDIILLEKYFEGVENKIFRFMLFFNKEKWFFEKGCLVKWLLSKVGFCCGGLMGFKSGKNISEFNKS